MQSLADVGRKVIERQLECRHLKMAIKQADSIKMWQKQTKATELQGSWDISQSFTTFHVSVTDDETPTPEIYNDWPFNLSTATNVLYKHLYVSCSTGAWELSQSVHHTDKQQPLVVDIFKYSTRVHARVRWISWPLGPQVIAHCKWRTQSCDIAYPILVLFDTLAFITSGVNLPTLTTLWPQGHVDSTWDTTVLWAPTCDLLQ